MMSQEAIGKVYKEFLQKNQTRIKYQQTEDALQERFLYYLQRNAKGGLDKITFSFINRGIREAKCNEMNNRNNRPLHFEDIKGTNDEIDVMDLIGEFDMKMENAVLNIDLENKIGEMSGKDPNVAKIIQLHLDGYKGIEISEMFGISKSVISRIVNMQTRQTRKQKRMKIDKTKLIEYKKVAKQHGKVNKSYIRIGDIVLRNDGRIFSKKNYFNGTKTGNEYVNYIDEVSIEQFKVKCKEIQ